MLIVCFNDVAVQHSRCYKFVLLFLFFLIFILDVSNFLNFMYNCSQNGWEASLLELAKCKFKNDVFLKNNMTL